ncbi:carboxypeptidase-like regulatory domain-containing protein [Winogradskya consettensis]|uniref:carboxypeptidase-like regulatory domain-containing protein n=1 Tax=Winogradskya consettensis TaxID=113560 RepID=UPI001BB30B73|nr:carboxypeptidase-like regulatory domain-containing protein [Actinoplanes consettensis]
MTTHLRARAVQAGAFLALVGAAIFAAPMAALADSPTVSISSLSSGDIPSGGTSTLKFTVKNENKLGDVQHPETSASVVVSIEGGNGLKCSGNCDFDETIAQGQTSREFSVTLTAGSVDAGETDNYTVVITATIGGQDGSANRTIKVRGADKPQSIRQVSGKVKDQDGKGIAGATVGMRDSNGATFQIASGSNGAYSFRSTDAKPIAVGSLSVGAIKDGYKGDPVNASGADGKSINVPLTLTLIAATTSPTPSPSATTSTEPTDEATDEATEDETDAASDEAAPAPTNAANNSDGSGSTLFIILGGLLVAAGIGAIVLVMMRRKSAAADDDPDDPNGPNGGGPGGGPVPVGAGRYAGADETRLSAPVGGGRVSDATMIAPRSGAPSIADAPTMIHRTPVAPPVDEEFPDPYGAPLPQNGAYNAPGGWGTAAAGAAGAAGAGAAGAYGGTTQFGGAPAAAQNGYDGYDEQGQNGYDGYDDHNGYGEPAGYVAPEQQQRFDEPTGMYRPEAEPAYDGGYGQPAGSYQNGGYGADQDDQGGYGGNYGGAGTYGGGAPQGGGQYGGAAPQSGGAYGGGAAPQSGGAYGAGAAPQSGGAYGAARGDYGDQGGYGDQGYDQGGQHGGGYGGAPAAPQGGGQYGGQYGGAPQQGGGYGEQDGYAEQGGGYDQRGNGYGPEQQGGRRGAPRQQPPEATRQWEN